MSRNTLVSIVFFIGLVVWIILDISYGVPVVVYIVWVAIYLIVSTLGSCILSMQFFIPAKCSGAVNSESIAITFDDGPLPGNTKDVLRILDEHQVKAAFFCIGQRVAKHPDILNEVYQRGHLIGNHSYWHGKTFDLQFASAIEKELEETDELITETIGHTPRFFRPPYGVMNPMVANAVRRRKHIVVGWSVRSFDTVIRDPEKLFKRITRSLKGGDIILFHDYSASTLQILPAFIEHVKKLGLKVVRVDELLKEKAYV